MADTSGSRLKHAQEAEMLNKQLTLVISILAMSFLYISSAQATYPPTQEMLDAMEREGTLEEAKQRAFELGNHEMKRPRRGAMNITEEDPRHLADLIMQNIGRSRRDKSSSEISKMTSTELAWVELDMNLDGDVDERDLLVLGHPMPKKAAILPSLGYNKMLTILIEFSNYPKYFDASSIDDICYSPTPVPGYGYGSHRYFYDQSSYGNLDIDGDTFGWYMAENPRWYYHPDDNSGGGKREELILEACDAADAAGLDFSDYDNDGDGVVDQFAVVWTGPHGAWATFWWGYQTGMGSGKRYDGVRLGSYSWQWERSYGFGGNPPEPNLWSADVLIHETGHGLGIPDFYDYDGSIGPKGGVGGLDMMGGWSAEHGPYTKFVLGWMTPTIAWTNLDDELMEPGYDNPDAVIAMPGYDLATPWDEYFIISNRTKDGMDYRLPGDGCLLFHVDARVNAGGGTIWNNSYTEHKLLRVMEADGLEELENGGGGDFGDMYHTGEELSPVSTPNSDGYDAPTGMTINDIQNVGNDVTADFTLYPTAPADRDN